VAAARAFLRDPAILVMDEPTAALDVDTEQRLVDGYQRVMRGRTVIVITHRLDVARQADRIVTLNNSQLSSLKAQDLLRVET
jgi:ABC-type multidrug transport system fused ATPase/permease subunit